MTIPSGAGTRVKILAFDLGTRTGVAERREDGRWLAWGQDFKSFEDPVERNYQWSVWVQAQLRSARPTVVAYEEINFNRRTSYIPGQVAMLQVACRGLSVPLCEAVPLNRWKKWGPGKGNATPEEYRAALKEKHGYGVGEDEAAAIWVGMYAQAHLVESAA